MNNFIGLDIKKNSLRFASVTQKDANTVVDNFDEVIIEGNLYKTSVAMKENQLEKELVTFFKQNKLKQNNVIYCDFGFNLLIKNTTIIESLHKQKVKEAIFMELGTSISIPFEEATFDILTVKPLEKKEKNDETESKKRKKAAVNSEKSELEVNFVVANEKDLVYVGDSILETNNIPYAVEMSALAYHRLLTEFSSLKIKRNMYLLFELNCGEAVMTVMHKGVPIYTQYAEYNPDHWRVNINSNQDNWSEEWLFDEVYERNKLLSSIDSINRLINSFSNLSSGSGIKYILLMGENPLLETGIADFLSQHIDLPIITPELNIVDKKNKQLPIRYYKAVGLAMKKEELK